MGGKIFINYRRGDDSGFVQALFSQLERTFPTEELFMDVDRIGAGEDYVKVLEDQVAQCEVLLAVIGKGWLRAWDIRSGRRLDNPNDFVRVEIESALKQNKRIIPVLVHGARMPRTEELPESLRPLARRNALRLTHERFKADTEGLIKAIREALTSAEATKQTPPPKQSKKEASAQLPRLKPAVVLVSGNEPGAGKTTVCKTLVDYFTAYHIPTRAFNAGGKDDNSLDRYFPNMTDTIDMASVSDQMKVFDTLSSTDAIITLVDMQTDLTLPTLKILEDIGFLEAVKKRHLNFITFHVCDNSVSDKSTFDNLRRYFREECFFLARNLHKKSSSDSETGTQSNTARKGEIIIPKLNDMTMQATQMASVSFLTFVANKDLTGQVANYSFVMRGYTRHWLGEIWGEYDRIKLKDILAT
jgi:hypothetical protein